MTQKPVIAVDGPAASGKGTLSKNLAASLNYAHLDTGAVYRAASLHLVRRNMDFTPENAVLAAHHIREHLTPDMLQDPGLRSDEISVMTSKLSAIPAVRKTLEDIQRDFAKNPPDSYAGAVLDGRDIGTIICPQAEIKLFVTASTEIRAQRRLKELQGRGISAIYDAVLKDMQERDLRDTNRDIAPLKPASDAVILDTSDLTPDQALKQALAIVARTLGITTLG